MIYSNRKEIEMKNANQINVNQINNINIKETFYMKKKEFIKNNINIDSKQNSFLAKRDDNNNNYVLLIYHKKSKENKNFLEINAKNLNDTINLKHNEFISKNNNENINSNNKNENIAYNITIKNEIQKIKYKSKEKKKDKENEIKNEKISNNNMHNDKDKKNEILKEEKNNKENENKKDDYKQKEKNYKRIHILLSSSISKEKKDQRRLKNKDNIKLLYTYANNSNENNIKNDRNNSLKKKSIDNKINNHSLYICDYFDKKKKSKKANYSKETFHKENMSEQKYNYSFSSINSSHSKEKILKMGISEKNIKNHLFPHFSTTFKKKSSINLGLNIDKKISHYNKNLEKILSKARNHKTISVQKLKTKINIKMEQKEKICEEVEKEKERDESIERLKIIKNTSNSLDKKNNNTSKSSNKKNINKNKTHNFEINIKIKKDQAKEIKIYENGKYEGIIINGKREKIGTMEYNDGTKYEGEWNNDKQHGKGIFRAIPTNNNHLMLIKYEGDFVNDKKEGKGVAIYSNGDKYEGEWKNNKQYGRGIVIYSSGGRYEGDWAEGKFNGLGTYYLRNGEKYEGKFEDNRYNGYGKFHHLNGDILEGIFINDQPNGKCYLHKSDGTIEEHDF